ncbi:MAG TPA: hypothetical protein VGJ02_11595 [Pyrinomonadaceae bacterium]
MTDNERQKKQRNKEFEEFDQQMSQFRDELADKLRMRDEENALRRQIGEDA